MLYGQFLERVLAEEDAAVRARLAKGTPREEKVPCIWDVVDFMEWESCQSLGLTPIPVKPSFWSFQCQSNER